MSSVGDLVRTCVSHSGGDRDDVDGVSAPVPLLDSDSLNILTGIYCRRVCVVYLLCTLLHGFVRVCIVNVYVLCMCMRMCCVFVFACVCVCVVLCACVVRISYAFLSFISFFYYFYFSFFCFVVLFSSSRSESMFRAAVC